MKLARTATHALRYIGRDAISFQSATRAAGASFPQKFAAGTPVGRLTARWHVSARTGRLECSWSQDAAAANDPQLSRRGRNGRVLARLLSHRRNRRH